MAKDWKQQAREGGGKYLKFKNGTEYECLFLEGPTTHDFTSEAGKDVHSLEWIVEVDNEEKTLSVSSRRLLQLLADEDDDEPLNGSVFRIKAIGDGFERQWRVKRITRTRQVLISKPARSDEEKEERGTRKEVKDGEEDGDEEGGQPVLKRMKKDMEELRRSKELADQTDEEMEAPPMPDDDSSEEEEEEVPKRRSRKRATPSHSGKVLECSSIDEMERVSARIGTRTRRV